MALPLPTEPTASPSASQSVCEKGCGTVGRAIHGVSAARTTLDATAPPSLPDRPDRRARGSDRGARHILTDTEGHLLAVQVLAGRVQDRDGAKPLLRASRSLWACLETVFADGGYAGGLIAWAMRATNLVLCIVERAHALLRFGPLPHRRVIERRFGWLMTNR